jgi:aspartate aminotransferase
MAIKLAERVGLIKPSPTLAVSSKANELKAQGKDIINLSVGEPDFDTPDNIKEAAIKAIHEGKTKYTPVEGTVSLRKAVAEKFKRDNHLNYDIKQILVSCGAKQSIYNLCQALLSKGDEVIIPAPYWVSYPDMVVLAEGTPVFIETGLEDNFKITPQKLEKAITPKTKLIMLNSPSNPTGVAYSKSELAALAEVILRHPQILVASDDIYEHILWDKTYVNILNACPELTDRTLVINGVSKTYAMTGWRIGYAAGPQSLITAMTNIQSQSTSNPCSIAQAAAEMALNADQSFVADMVKKFKNRHDLVYNKLNEISGIECSAADGAFYLFPRVAQLFSKLNIQDDVAFCQYLLTHGVAVVPGSAFGAPGYIRLSTALSEENLTEAVARIKKAVN